MVFRKDVISFEDNFSLLLIPFSVKSSDTESKNKIGEKGLESEVWKEIRAH